MRYLKLFEELQLKFEKVNGVYYFKDTKGNEYRVYFIGPLTDSQLEDSHLTKKQTFDLEFITQDNDYTSLTGTGTPFSISNFIFGDILEDFVTSNPECERIVVSSLDRQRSALYLRSIKNSIHRINFEIEFLDYPVTNDIVLCRITS